MSKLVHSPADPNGPIKGATHVGQKSGPTHLDGGPTNTESPTFTEVVTETLEGGPSDGSTRGPNFGYKPSTKV